MIITLVSVLKLVCTIVFLCAFRLSHMHVIPWLSHEHCRYQHISCFSTFPYAIVVAVRPHFSHEIAVIG